MASYPVKNYSSASATAGVLSGTPGSLAAVLRACLGTGHGSKAVQTLTIAGGIATASYASAHPYSVGTVLRVAGAGLAAANGEQLLLSATAGAVTFAVPGAPDGVVSGVITTNIAPASWTELYPGTANVLVIKPSVPNATGCVLRLDDTGTTTARAIGYETMSDAANGMGLFPSAVQKAGGLYWGKSNVGDATARAWRLFADERGLLLWVSMGAAGTHGYIVGFGDIAPTKSGDAYGCFISGGETVSVSGDSSQCLGVAWGYSPPTAPGFYLARAATGLGGAVAGVRTTGFCSTSATSVFSGRPSYFNPVTLPYPNPADNSLRLSDMSIFVNNEGLRGSIPGLLHTPQIVGEAFQTGEVIDGQGPWTGRKLMALRVGQSNSVLSGAGVVFVDLTGPWSR